MYHYGSMNNCNKLNDKSEPTMEPVEGGLDPYISTRLN